MLVRMDFARPLQVVTPTLDGDILRALARADAEFTGRQVRQLIGRGSDNGVRRALQRLVGQGIVLRRPAGRADLFRFNAEHIAAPSIQGLVDPRAELVDRLRREIGEWAIEPVAAAIFGSVARGTARTDSDIDLLFVRPPGVDDDRWEAQVAGVAAAATRYTGNDARPLDLASDEVDTEDPVVRDVLEHGIEIGGSLRRLRRLSDR